MSVPGEASALPFAVRVHGNQFWSPPEDHAPWSKYHYRLSHMREIAAEELQDVQFSDGWTIDLLRNRWTLMPLVGGPSS